MSCDFYQLANPGVRDLTPYEPGKPIDELERELGITGSIKLAASISGLEVFTKIVLYYVHERVWSRLQFGRQYQPPPDYQI